MNSPPAVPDRGNLRISDADRERVAEILREAAGEGRLSLGELDERLEAAYAAKTYAELEPITRDLPSSGTGHAPSPSASPAGDVHRFGGEPTSSAAVAILGGFDRRGEWVVPGNFTAVAVLGGGSIDLREARFAEPAVTIHAVAVLGGIEITVPEDATVQVSGVGIMGGFDHGVSGSGQAGGPKIIVNGLAFMGGVEVRRKRPRECGQGKLEPGRGHDGVEPCVQARLEHRRQRLESRLEARRRRMESRRARRFG
jgi:hypothetical protein